MAKRLTIAALALLSLLALAAPRAAEPSRVTVSPDKIQIGLFYGGQQVSVRAAVPEAEGVVVRVSGSTIDVKLKKKGRKAGILWMNVGEVEFRSVPSLMIVRSSSRLDLLASLQSLESLGIGYEALESKIVEPGDPEEKRLFGEMVRLKERERLFSTKEGGIKFTPLGHGFQEASVSFFLPPKVTPGNYAVEVFAFKGGRGELLGRGSFEVDFSHSTEYISRMAKEHGLLYGCLAAIIAVLAGLLTGFIFGGKGGAH
jgi:uncharacterized protein (TIGR02186 family)